MSQVAEMVSLFNDETCNLRVEHGFKIHNMVWHKTDPYMVDGNLYFPTWEQFVILLGPKPVWSSFEKAHDRGNAIFYPKAANWEKLQFQDANDRQRSVNFAQKPSGLFTLLALRHVQMGYTVLDCTAGAGE
jgi:hypothetical protein